MLLASNCSTLPPSTLRPTPTVLSRSVGFIVCVTVPKSVGGGVVRVKEERFRIEGC